MARPIAREAAMQLVFEQLFGGDATAQTLVDLIDYNPNEKDSTYIDTVVGGVKAVSYTHLDVYKRQDSESGGSAGQRSPDCCRH